MAGTTGIGPSAVQRTWQTNHLRPYRPCGVDDMVGRTRQQAFVLPPLPCGMTHANWRRRLTFPIGPTRGFG
ncbi:hypothetical protein [Belnapia sp. F-4-1]|uniref:hypothetical protein n=1 Tax=Belnapia sp. F-4-1 TaxID=1545443 RepID=UPI0005B8B9D1|nr:hypothetical protein [Belnapia sp. F-4-1]